MSVIKIREAAQAAVGISAGEANIIVKNGTVPLSRAGGWGVGFGPLRIAPYESKTIVINDLQFEALDRYSLPFLDTTAGVSQTQMGVGAAGLPLLAASTTDDDHAITRRNALLAAGSLVGASVASTGVSTAQESDDDTTRSVATFELEESPRGIQIGIDDMVAQYLPVGSEYFVEINDSVVGSFTAGGDGGGGALTTGPQITGTVRVISKEGISFLKRVLARISGSEPLVYTFRTSEPLSSYARGEEVVIADQPLVVDAIDSAGPDGTIVRAGGEAVDHLDEGSSSYGNWYVRDGVALVYEVGVDSPDATDIELKINASRLETIQADLLG